MRVINLTHGAGNGVDKACLMTASNMLIGKGEDGDDNSCVCPLLRKFIVPTNDRMPESLLGELYGPLIWEILGTRNDDPEVIRQRSYAFADWSVRDVLPIVMESIDKASTASELRSLPEIVGKQTAVNARKVARAAAAYAAYAAAAYSDAYPAAYAAAYAAAAAAAADASYAAADAAAAAADADAAENIWRMCPEIIRKVASIGDQRPVECVLSHDQLCDALGQE